MSLIYKDTVADAHNHIENEAVGGYAVGSEDYNFELMHVGDRRFAWLDNAATVSKYQEVRDSSSGCKFDELFDIGGRLAICGCTQEY